MQERHVNGDAQGGGGVPPRAAEGQPSVTPRSEREGFALRDYLSVLWRRKWLILAVTVAATALGFGLSSLQTRIYEASADLIYEKPLDISNPLTGQGYTDANERNLELRSVGSVLASPDMQGRANALLQRDGVAVTGFEVSSAPLQDTPAGTAGTSSNVVRITASSKDPRLAAAAANAYAAAYVAWRKERVQKQITDAVDALQKKVKDYTGAAKRSTEYLVMQQRLQDLELLAATATGNFRVLVPATVPITPVSPKPVRNALLGFVLGLFAGVALAFVLEQFDTRLLHAEDAARILRLPVVGRIPRISKRLLDNSALITFTEPDSPSAEAFRMLRTNLNYVNPDGDIRSVLLTSCVQGEGKSVTIANLAVTLAMSGKKVIVVDADLRRPRMHAYFGLPNDRGVSTVVSGQTELIAAMQAVPTATMQPVPSSPASPASQPAQFDSWADGVGEQSRLYVLTSGPPAPNPGEIVSSKRFGQILDGLAPKADIILVDSPAMLVVGDTPALADKVDGLLFLVEPDVVGRHHLAQAREQLDKLPCALLGVIVARRKSSGSYYASGYYYREDEGGKRVRAAKTPTA
jgi:non-specific protein-tyrosine kinase